ncbi:Mog1p/PsbP-like protein [Suhomyces tanzawaensis NRRL Y-17324]|uniref:Mog1p/PsbP-like protein n=1 Tax=Suhomyces tanzawaensis NRRL Y-17324 TaxID=984487 RepID=A0A1E4SQS2_9ASCO|nr:Mog1p/PsbP-like protein [Suhomyces tanzawaensis NRRL Y-17324]ODV81845.1 Mog1p/PsbP-like protein [Suhomyces tanzawaensis NRRL Y-17324]
MVQLYGGAALADIAISPSQALVDVSRIRQVPDTQEVFIIEDQSLTSNTSKWDQSVIFDLLERVELDEYDAAIGMHLEDIAEGATNHFVEAVATKTGEPAHLSYFCVENPRRDRREPDLPGAVVTMVALIRLARVATDVLITMNVPVASEAAMGAVAESEAYKKFRDISGSYTIHDWELFG